MIVDDQVNERMMTMIENDSGMNFVCKIPCFFPASPWGMPKPLEKTEKTKVAQLVKPKSPSRYIFICFFYRKPDLPNLTVSARILV
jgi:hypothetical protein